MSEKIKVSELDASSSRNDEDLIMIVQENSDNELENFKQTRADFLAGVYEVPSGGIPKTDLASAVQTSLGKADTAVQDVSGKEDKSNKVTSLSSSSTDTQYPSAKCVYDLIGDINSALDLINGESI